MAQEPMRFTRNVPNLLRNPLRTEIVQCLRGGHALSSGYRRARTFANDDTADWGSQSQYRGLASRRRCETRSQVYVPMWMAWLSGPSCTLAKCKDGTKFSGFLTSCKKLFNSRIGSVCCQGTERGLMKRPLRTSTSRHGAEVVMSVSCSGFGAVDDD